MKSLSVLSISILSGALALLPARPAGANAVTANPQWSLINARTAQIDHQGNLIVIIGSTVFAFGAAGNTLWSFPMPADPDNGDPFVNNGHILVDFWNSVYVESYDDKRSDSPRLVLAKISSSGSLVWGAIKTYTLGPVGSGEHGAVGPMALGTDGSLYVVGHSGQFSTATHPTTLLRINGFTGNEVSRKSLADSNDAQVGMTDSLLSVDHAGRVFYGGPQGIWSFSADLQTQRWTRGYPVRAVTFDRWNGVYITGVGIAANNVYNMFVSRLDTDGNTVWDHLFLGQARPFTYPMPPFGSTQDDRAVGGNCIAIDSADQVYAGGYASDSSGYNGGMIAKLDPVDGSLAWSQHYGTTNANAAVLSLALDERDNLYIAGQQTGHDAANRLGPRLAIISPAGDTAWASGGQPFDPDTGIDYGYVDTVLLDQRGNSYWGYFQSGPGFSLFTVAKESTTGRAAVAIATPGTGKSKVVLDTFNHNNVQLQTFSAGDVLQAGPTTWSQSTYGQWDRDVAGGPDGSVRILQTRERDGLNEAAVTLVIRDDAGNQTSSHTFSSVTFSFTNFRATRIAVGSDNKSYVLLRSVQDGSAMLWRVSADGGTIERTATFAAIADKAPVGVAVDGTSIVYLIWQGLNGTIYPWRLDTSLSITNQTATLSGAGYLVSGADVGADHRLRIVGRTKTTLDPKAWSLNNTGGLVDSRTYSLGGSWRMVDLSVGADNRTHFLWNDNFFGQFQYSVAFQNLMQSLFHQYAMPAP